MVQPANPLPPPSTFLPRLFPMHREGAEADGAQPRTETLFVSIVTAPVRARARPIMFAPVFSVMLASARIFPTNVVVVPRDAELPICQKTLQGEPPLIMRTDEALAVVSVLPILKMKTALAELCASRVSMPVN